MRIPHGHKKSPWQLLISYREVSAIAKPVLEVNECARLWFDASTDPCSLVEEVTEDHSHIHNESLMDIFGNREILSHVINELDASTQYNCFAFYLRS